MRVPLQLPGAPELLIFMVPVAAIVAMVGLLRRRSGRIQELEARVEELEAERQNRV